MMSLSVLLTFLLNAFRDLHGWAAKGDFQNVHRHMGTVYKGQKG